eukprot:TRINITY_DN13460_c0_g1_i3.p1 TRINITY_DN13460_c0_g1~~TRINITY_DN13460_c0_g1_i3.p1  ORF type:complete len:294 (+),score=71.87 TRINITY_DN13460_c0_g1_i3:645-1526(+)
MPIIALGTAGYDNNTAEAAVAMALGAGLTHVHTALDYFNAAGIGRAIANTSREAVFITGMTPPCLHTAGPPVRNVSSASACEELTLSEIDSSLKALGIRQYDLLLLHGPNAPFNNTAPCTDEVCGLNQAQWRAYRAALALGKARAIGVSNYCGSCLACLGDPTPAVNQIQLHVGTGPDPEGLVSRQGVAGVVTQGYSPLAHGAVLNSSLVQEVADVLNKSEAQVGLRWVLQNPRSKMAVVVKADKLSYLLQDLQLFDWEIDSKGMTFLDLATQPKGQQGGRPCWGCQDSVTTV